MHNVNNDIRLCRVVSSFSDIGVAMCSSKVKQTRMLSIRSILNGDSTLEHAVKEQQKSFQKRRTRKRKREKEGNFFF